MTQPKIFLGMPGRGGQSEAAGRGFWRACRDMDRVWLEYAAGSLLATNFNRLWCRALNLATRGDNIGYFAMLHNDVGPEDFWLDKLIAELEDRDLDVLGVVVPIKDPRGLTSLALDDPLDSWRVKCRLSMSEIMRLPPTFTSDDLGHRLLLNTGCWVCRFEPSWARRAHFQVNDRIVINEDTGEFEAQVEPEDWFFSRGCHEMGLKIGATRKVRCGHRGIVEVFNDSAWGTCDIDREYVSESLVPFTDREGYRYPHDVDGWLRWEEGKALFNLARGKRVLEIGSYCGKSTICLAQTASHVTAVDPHDGRATPRPKDTFAEMLINLQRYGVDSRVQVHCSTMATAAIEADEKFDVAFIDGAHDYESVQADIEACRNLLAPGGLLLFHDYRRTPGEHDGGWDPGVTQAVDELLRGGGEMLFTEATLAVVRPSAAIPLEV